MTGDTHYDLEILAELAEGLLDDAEARPVRAHLAVCDPCGERLADLAAVREVLAATPTPAMPMGVALRIDQALAAEAGRTGRVAAAVADSPDWDRLMADAPWETASGPSREPAPSQEPSREPEPVRLGVVADDGTVVPAKRRTRPARRRRWAIPVTAAAAVAAIAGSATLSTGLLTASGGGGPAPVASVPIVLPPPASVEPSQAPRLAYKISDSDFNYSNRALREPLGDYFAPTRAWLTADSVDDKLMRCIGRVSKQVGKDPFQVDQGYYEGQEASLMLFRKNSASNKVQVRVLDPECKNLRKPALGTWD
ncbi:hypothetical protein C1I98_36110 [Spongiactinospora gelatinilytica]|uniref:Zinc-finger domain-containing protein n=1 Tax=Spongiactinospora gelatinilytica TaxID=2666298 RepID=A0A2W2EN57_9ACTN|nr:zf-HC2 domain-containing protein [Spongiactinospora gelatinilytica]PZG23833.1 hypothetical protein C1I98_36110 [Spongiactinospora gelatinilytica]